jgi:hypothetical protein
MPRGALSLKAHSKELLPSNYFLRPRGGIPKYENQIYINDIHYYIPIAED